MTKLTAADVFANASACGDHPLQIDSSIVDGAETILALGGCCCRPANESYETCGSFCDSSSFAIARQMTPIRRDAPTLDGAESSAIFSEDERHRYVLTRKFPGHVTGSGHPLFLMLNPSTATHGVGDPTVTRCAGFAREWGYTAFTVANLFSLRSTDPSALKTTTDAEGDPHNLFSIGLAVRDASIVICAWGVNGTLRGRDAAVKDYFAENGWSDKMYCLGVTKAGHPKHPLYLRRDCKPIRFGGNS